jgi:hypothetical protein
LAGRNSNITQSAHGLYRVVTIEKNIDFAAHGVTGSIRNKPGGRSKSPEDRFRDKQKLKANRKKWEAKNPDKMKRKRETFLKTHPTYYKEYSKARRLRLKTK